MIRIIKIGGKLIENDAVLNGLCDELSACYRDSVLVHGGGSMAGQLSARLGIRTRMIDGRPGNPGGCRDGLCRMGE